jgi:glycosyltransferase involved in cell wall biosynthesis
VDEHPPIEKVLARKTLGMPECGKVVGCVGVLNERKGIDLLLKAFASSSLERSDRLLLVGRLSDSLERLIADEYSSLLTQDRLVIRDRFVTGLEMATALCAMDLVCTPYREQYGIGSVILNANIMGRPVLSSNSGWPLLVVEGFGLGTTCDVHDLHGFASALEQGLRQAPYFELSASSRRLAAYHAPSNFAAHITRKPREMLGLSPPSDLISWQSVLASGTCAQVVRQQ